MDRPYLFPESGDGLTWFEEVQINNEQDYEVDDGDPTDPSGWMCCPSAHIDGEHDVDVMKGIPCIEYGHCKYMIKQLRRLVMGRNKEVVKIRTTLIDKKKDGTVEEKLQELLKTVSSETGTVVSATLQYELPDGSTREVYVYNPWQEDTDKDE